MSRSADQIHRELHSLTPPGWAMPRGADTLFAALLRPMAEGLAELEQTAEATLAEINPRSAAATIGDYERVLGPTACGIDGAGETLDKRQRLAHARWTARGGQDRQYFIDMAVALGYSVAHAAHLPAPVIDTVAGTVVTPAAAPVISGRGEPGATIEIRLDEAPEDAVTIEEFRPFTFGVSRCGSSTWAIGPLVDRFHWIVHMPGEPLGWFRMGASRCGMDPLMGAGRGRARWFRMGASRCGVDPHVDFDRADDLECLVRAAQPAHGKVTFRYAAYF